MKSLTFYQHANIRPSWSGGYVDCEEQGYSEIVEGKHIQAITIAHGFYNDINDGKYTLTKEELNQLFNAIHKECNFNYKGIRNRVLNYKTYE